MCLASLRSSRGNAIIIALGLTAILFTASLTISSLIMASYLAAGNISNSNIAFYSAEGGIEKAYFEAADKNIGYENASEITLTNSAKQIFQITGRIKTETTRELPVNSTFNLPLFYFDQTLSVRKNVPVLPESLNLSIESINNINTENDYRLTKYRNGSSEFDPEIINSSSPDLNLPLALVGTTTRFRKKPPLNTNCVLEIPSNLNTLQNLQIYYQPKSKIPIPLADPANPYTLDNIASDRWFLYPIPILEFDAYQTFIRSPQADTDIATFLASSEWNSVNKTDYNNDWYNASISDSIDLCTPTILAANSNDFEDPHTTFYLDLDQNYQVSAEIIAQFILSGQCTSHIDDVCNEGDEGDKVELFLNLNAQNFDSPITINQNTTFKFKTSDLTLLEVTAVNVFPYLTKPYLSLRSFNNQLTFILNPPFTLIPPNNSYFLPDDHLEIKATGSRGQNSQLIETRKTFEADSPIFSQAVFF